MARKKNRLRLESLESREVPAGPANAPSLGAPPPPSATVTWVSTVSQLQSAVQNLQSNRTIVIQPGVYQLTAPLFVANGTNVTNVMIRGATDNYNDVVIRGAGMDNSSVNFGFSFYNAQDVTVANVSVGEVWFHAIDIQGGQGADRINLYHCRLYNAGQQIIKGNPGTSNGADGVTVNYCMVEYTNGPSTVDHGIGAGYTNGISALKATNWQVRNNVFRNFHTPDSSQWQWNPAVLFWGQSAGAVVEGNTFIDVDRAVALGLVDVAGGFDHQGGFIRDNFVYQRPGLFSAARAAASDGMLLVYDSPNTQVYHNTILNNGNSSYSVEVRWSNSGVVVSNNLADDPLRARDGGTWTGGGNFLSATSSMFVNPAAGDLHTVNNAATQANVIDRGITVASANDDFDLGSRPIGAAPDVGADEHAPAAPPPPTVSSVAVNGGSTQRSRVTSVAVTFNSQVTLPATPANAFQLRRQSDNALVGLTANVNNTGPGTVVTLTFTGALSNFGSLQDGRYTLTILANQVTSAGGQLDGNANGTGGDNYVLASAAAPAAPTNIFRLFGDNDGDGDADGVDFTALRATAGLTTGNTGFNNAFDFDNDGDIDATDFLQFRQRSGTTV